MKLDPITNQVIFTNNRDIQPMGRSGETYIDTMTGKTNLNKSLIDLLNSRLIIIEGDVIDIYVLIDILLKASWKHER